MVWCAELWHLLTTADQLKNDLYGFFYALKKSRKTPCHKAVFKDNTIEEWHNTFKNITSIFEIVNVELFLNSMPLYFHQRLKQNNTPNNTPNFCHLKEQPIYKLLKSIDKTLLLPGPIAEKTLSRTLISLAH